MAKKNGIEPVRGSDYLRGRVQTEYQYFPEDYFTGQDVTVYFGDIWVDELTSLSFTMRENVRPVYGYASRTFDRAIRGNRIVEGQFRIAFKEAGYLHTIMNHIGQMQDAAKPRIAYLLGGEEVPDWLAGVKDNIEDTLQRWHGGLVQVADKEEEFVDEYEWDTLSIGDTDATKPNTAGRKRGGNGGTQYTGAISQLQDRLIEIGFGWAPTTFNWNKRGSISIPAKILEFHGNPTDWYMIQTYKDGNPIISTFRDNDPQVKSLVDRLLQYPFIQEFSQQWALTHYAYGDNLKEALQLFMEFAGINDGSQGRWVTSAVKQAIEGGLEVNGRFDAATKMALMAYQKSRGLPVTGVVDWTTRRWLSPRGTKSVSTQVVNNPASGVYNEAGQPESMFSKYEKEVWGRASSSNTEHTNRTHFYGPELDLEGGKYLQKNGFDIYINYGSYPENIIRWKGGGAKSIEGGNVTFNTTVKAIRNVQLQMVGQVLDASGQPIEEVYSFIAKDID